MSERGHLLPKNSTPIERAISLAIDPLAKVQTAILWLPRYKHDAPDPALPFLVWEYALAEIVPYLPNLREAIRQGLRWQRLRGTPAALRMALGWVAQNPVVIEEEEPSPAHWAEYQFDAGRVLWDAEIEPVIVVARLSQPARSRLSRIFHGEDVRRFLLDRSPLDEALLSDHSGVFWTDGVTKLSFGRLWADAVFGADHAVNSGRVPAHHRYGRYPDICRLDEMLLSACRSLPNPEFEHGHCFELTQRDGLTLRWPLAPHRRFCKAEIVPSEQWALEDTNSCFPAREWVPGEPFYLGDALSDVRGGSWREIVERFERQTAAAVAGPDAVVVQAGGHREVFGVLSVCWILRLSDGWLDEPGFYDRFGAARLVTMAGRYWPSARWVTCGPWRDEATWSSSIHIAVTWPARPYCLAQVVPSEQWPLGDTNACLPAREWVAADVLYLSDGRLCDLRGGSYAPIVERVDRTTGSSPVALPDVLIVSQHEQES